MLNSIQCVITSMYYIVQAVVSVIHVGWFSITLISTTCVSFILVANFILGVILIYVKFHPCDQLASMWLNSSMIKFSFMIKSFIMVSFIHSNNCMQKILSMNIVIISIQCFIHLQCVVVEIVFSTPILKSDLFNNLSSFFPPPLNPKNAPKSCEPSRVCSFERTTLHLHSQTPLLPRSPS